jgi:hypothetical protein
MITTAISKLMDAEKKAAQLFAAIEDRGLIVAGKSERMLNNEVFALAKEMFGIDKYWHKRIVRSGSNTLKPYYENPPKLILQPDDILFFDFGPIFEDWEADFGRTYVLGDDPYKRKLKADIESAWHAGKTWFDQQSSVTGAALYTYIIHLAGQYGWAFEAEMAGHLIGQFPHERLKANKINLYVHPGNQNDMRLPDAKGRPRNWILEIHFIDKQQQIGGFFEQVLC